MLVALMIVVVIGAACGATRTPAMVLAIIGALIYFGVPGLT